MVIFDETDRQILACLGKAPAHCSSIARRLNLPRTTVAYRAERLAKLHRVEKKIIGRKTVWRLSTRRVHNKNILKEFEGVDFIECYKALFTVPKESIVYAVQGSQAGEAELKNVPHSFITEAHTYFTSRRIVMRGISNKKLFDTLSNLDEALLKSHRKRPQALKTTNRLFTSGGELFATEHFILLVNPGAKRGVVIKDKDIVSLCFDTMSLLFSLSDKLETVNLDTITKKS